MPAWTARFIDVRRGERRAVTHAFLILFLILSAHTMLETARDVLLLTKLPVHTMGVAYLSSALCVIPASGLASRAAQRSGVRAALVGALVSAAGLLGVLFILPMNGVVTVAIYSAAGLIGAVLIPLFWSLVSSIFTVVQGRRLLGVIAAAGALGAAAGSGVAAAMLSVVHAKGLLFTSAVVFVATTAVVVLGPKGEGRTVPTSVAAQPPRPWGIAREEPFAVRIAVLAIVSTAAVVALDYFFKWTVARDVPRARVAHFIAVFYAVLNGVALVTQLVGTGALVRRVGVATALVITPLLLFFGAFSSLLAGGTLVAVLVLKAIDGTMRNSVHRIATELIYMPVRPALRAIAKPFIDGGLARSAQALVGATLLVLGTAHYLSSRSLALGVFALVALWLLFAVGTRRPYLALLSRAIASDTFDPHSEGEPLDRASAEELVHHLADEDPLTVVGAMNSLARRGRAHLIPALVLLHQEEAILLRALQIFTESRRADWISRARRLLGEPREPVRIAAARALAVHGRLESGDLNDESSPRLRGYAALHFALEHGAAQVLADPHISEVMAGADSVGEEAQLGLLSAIADAPRSPSLLPLIRMLDERAKLAREWTEGLARAVAGQGAEDLLPSLIKRLPKRDGVEAVREALVSFGRPALQLLLRTLQDGKAERAIRIQLPTSVARFGTAEAAELLLKTVETEGDGRVRYKAIRALGQLVSQQSLGLDRLRVERLSRQNLVEFFRILGLRVAFAEATSVPVPGKAFSTTGRLLLGLLDDKLRQSLERSFRLLKIAHPDESIHRVHISLLSKDPRSHAAAAEFLDTLLRFTDQQPLRKLFQVLEDDLADDERVARAAPLLELAAPATRSEALERLTRDSDATLSALATAHVSELAGEPVALDWDSLSVGQIPRWPVALLADVSHDV